MEPSQDPAVLAALATEDAIHRIAGAARALANAYDEFGPDPRILAFPLECLGAALAGVPSPRDEDPQR